MKKAKKTAVCGIITALSATVMLFSYFPYLTYAVPAAAGLFAVILLIEYGAGWAFLSFSATSVIVMLTAETEAKFIFVFFFGYYPILKGIMEKHLRPILAYPIKILCFNAALAAAYYFITVVFGITLPDTEGLTGVMFIAILLLANLVFLVYDRCLNGIAAIYFSRIRPSIARYL